MLENNVIVYQIIIIIIFYRKMELKRTLVWETYPTLKKIY